MAIELGLDRIQKLLSFLEYKRPTIHVAGTNGKGSVSTLIEQVLLASGLSTGKFNSPHLIHLNDSIAIKGSPITLDSFSIHSSKVKSISDAHDIHASSFELLTATALTAFEDAMVDVVILEVGMGGRLDATNAVPDEQILVSVITAIDLDHQAFLGSTIAEIAREKAGIVRSDGIVILGGQSPPNEADVRAAVSSITSACRASLMRSNKAKTRPWDLEIDRDTGDSSFVPNTHQPIILPSIDWNSTEYINTRLGLLGEHQLSNAGLAHTVLGVLRASYPETFGHITDAHIDVGFSNAKWPGRLTWLTVPASLLSNDSQKPTVSSLSDLTLLVDGAHNSASAETLSTYLTTVDNPSRTFILALSHSPPKKPADTLSKLLRHGDRVALVPFHEPVEGMPWVRNEPREEAEAVIRQIIGERGDIWSGTVTPAVPNQRALKEALAWARENGGLTVLAGSLYLVGDLYRFLQENGS